MTLDIVDLKAIVAKFKSYGRMVPVRPELMEELIAFAERYVGLADRIGTIADEANGPHPVLSADDALTQIEKALFSGRQRASKAETEREAAERNYRAVCEALGTLDYAEGQGPVYPSVDVVCAAIRQMSRELSEHADSRIPKERESWHEDDGPVVWWSLPISEPPYVGTPLDDDFPEYVTHWTRLQEPVGGTSA